MQENIIIKYSEPKATFLVLIKKDLIQKSFWNYKDQRCHLIYEAHCQNKHRTSSSVKIPQLSRHIGINWKIDTVVSISGKRIRITVEIPIFPLLTQPNVYTQGIKKHKSYIFFRFTIKKSNNVHCEIA